MSARRVITGGDENEKSRILYDDTVGKVEVFSSGSRLHTIWFTDSLPVDCSPATDVDPTHRKNFNVANEGTVCMIVSSAPGTSAPMHRTKSIDYGIVIEGEVELELDNGEKRLLKTGDVIVQRETTHAWHNRHATKWAKIFFVVIACADWDGGEM